MFRRISQHPTAMLIVSTGFSLALSFGTPFLMVRWTQPGTALTLFLLGAILLTLILPFALVILSIVFAFSRHPARASRLRFVVCAYVFMIFIFAGLYFVFTFYADLRYAVDSYGYYRASGQWIGNARDAHLRPYSRMPRAFVGFNEHLWGTIYDEQQIFPPVTFGKQDDPELELARLAQVDSDRVIVFRRSAVLEVLSDCLHLSVMTLATVGYGNLAPTTWYAKLATDVEALSAPSF